MREQIDRVELARLRAIERRARLLLINYSDEHLAQVVGGNWQEDKVRACISDLRQLVNGASAQEVTWNPAAI